MERYIKTFDTSSDVQTAIDNGSLGKPYVAYVESDGAIDWNTKNPPKDWSKEYLTFKITDSGLVYWKSDYYSTIKTISYSINGGEWTEITSNTGDSAPSISVIYGDIIKFKGNNSTYGTTDHYSSFSGTTAGFEVEGNIMSLVDSTGFTTATTLQGNCNFYNLFNNCTGLTSAENLILPATTLAYGCYEGMFNGCTSLTSAPELPATGVSQYCYANMFSGCTSLTTAPELPATTLASSCYSYMFQNCTSLTTAPELPATTLASSCYRSMFDGCTSLNYIKCLATNKSASMCTNNWVSGVSSTGTFVKNANMSSWTTGTSGIPTGWTVIDA